MKALHWINYTMLILILSMLVAIIVMIGTLTGRVIIIQGDTFDLVNGTYTGVINKKVSNMGAAEVVK